MDTKRLIQGGASATVLGGGDYAFIHELCHIAEHNHNKQFWRLLGQQTSGLVSCECRA
ncbi:M48 family metallopeptidase [Marinobacter hydrocarbonoclasticus]|nr:M48 family metallopeptidase [Marinobacter nauticus]